MKTNVIFYNVFFNWKLANMFDSIEYLWILRGRSIQLFISGLNEFITGAWHELFTQVSIKVSCPTLNEEIIHSSLPFLSSFLWRVWPSVARFSPVFRKWNWKMVAVSWGRWQRLIHNGSVSIKERQLLSLTCIVSLTVHLDVTLLSHYHNS